MDLVDYQKKKGKMLQGRCVRRHTRGGRKGNRGWIRSYFIASYMKYYMNKGNYIFFKEEKFHMVLSFAARV